MLSHSDTSHDSAPVKRSCSAQTRTQELLDKDETYRSRYEAAHQYADEYVAYMREHKSTAFHKTIEKTLEGIRTNNNNKDNNSKNEKKGSKYLKKSKKQKQLQRLRKYKEKAQRRLLFSEYDDEIDKEPVIKIPVVFHVLYSNSDENLSEAQLQSQIDVLNKDFRATNAEIVEGKVPNVWSDRVGDSKLEFYLNRTIRVQIASTASTCSDDGNMKVSASGGSSGLDPSIYLNIWTCDLSDEGLLGYAYFPCLLGGGSEYLDGVVLTSGSVGSIDYDDGTFYFTSSSYNEGRTGTHEVGHYLNLHHVWGSSEGFCDDTEDYVSDTPAQSGPNYNCPDNSTNSCTDTDPEKGRDLRDMYENYMDYVNDNCMFIFSEEQVWRMRSVFDVCRTTMYSNGAIIEDGAYTNKNHTVNEELISLTCHNGNPITEERLDDGDCDCSCCEDETLWTCDTCSSDIDSCSEEMFSWTVCDGTGDGSISGTYCRNGTLLVDNTGGDDDDDSSDEPVYVDCHNGNSITDDKIDDGNCDCSCCEDEADWTCETCSNNPNTCSERKNVFVECDGTGNGTIIGTYCMNGTLISSGSNNNNENETGLTDDAFLLIIVVSIGIGVGLIAAIGVVIATKKYDLSGTGAAVPIATTGGGTTKSKSTINFKSKSKSKNKSTGGLTGLAGLSGSNHHVVAEGNQTPSTGGGLPPPYTGPPPFNGPPPVPSSATAPKGNVTGAAKAPPRFGGPRPPPPSQAKVGGKRPPPPPSSGRRW